MRKWKIKFGESMLPHTLILSAEKAEFSDCKILGSKYNPDCYPVEQYKTVDEEEREEFVKVNLQNVLNKQPITKIEKEISIEE